MINIDKLKGLAIYTVEGTYVGLIKEIVLNMRTGTISKIQINNKLIEEEEIINFSIVDVLNHWFSLSENSISKNSNYFIEYDNIIAIGDIVIVDINNVKTKEEDSQSTYI
ncbi:PRC-barrel domain-containing protein [Methanobrevibacter filiformis]|uniref:PRC-barrel domain protein n=1 Tax=Methanobrevibacter filiformis TaxID=55758 RepID=A0A165ZH87_9EURY|nr:PRC-barrel domain-containing protein [Methanobrevibacter filiformis]KZX10716.1 PRC-barrel domain protein [Methanobrevibacter filiformis]